jgi:SAM-dependent methyltransferase
MSNFPKFREHHAVELFRSKEANKYDDEYFRQHYWREDLPGLTGNRGLSYDDADHTRRFRFLYKNVIAPQCPRRMLDAGCGTGLLIDEALAAGLDAWGIDISPAAKAHFLNRTRPEWSNRFILSSITDLPFDSESFDLCLCIDVLEHIPFFDIVDAVRELCRVSSNKVICSVNMDNPYEYHPTILSRDSWVALFHSTGLAQLDATGTNGLNIPIQAIHPEYEFFVFERMHAIKDQSCAIDNNIHQMNPEVPCFAKNLQEQQLFNIP